MNKILIAITGFMMMVALVVGGPGVAKATIATVAIEAGPSLTTLGTNTITASEIDGSWFLYGYNASSLLGGVTILGGDIILNTSTNTATFSGTIGTNAFDVAGILTSYHTPPSNNTSYYSWDIMFPNLAALSNSTFALSGPYSGSISVQQETFTPTLGLSAVSLAVSSAPVPVPPSVLLLAPGLLGLVGIRKRIKR